MREIFSWRELQDMSNVFESSWETTTTPRAAMRAIMRNIIANNGTFKPAVPK